MTARMNPRARGAFQRRLLAWFRAHRRDLPWRRSRDPYRVWVAEVMLQQTRIAAVLPYYRRFLEKFPQVTSLARARQEDVLKLWSGLGYYSRARNLRRAAKEIVVRYGGKFPQSLAEALRLPGVGRYTAAAVLSIAYDMPLAVLDGNVARVLARLSAMRGDVRAPRNWKAVGSRAEELLATEASGDWNQALMELGETVCTPQSPRCPQCPVERWCRARALGLVEEIPEARRKPRAVHVKIAAAILRDPQGRTLMVKDPGAHDGVLFSRMWQFPAVEVARHAKAELGEHLRATLGIEPPILEDLAEARHAVTDRNVQLLAFLGRVPLLPKRLRTRIVPLEALARLPISSATLKIAQAALGARG